MRSDPTYQEWLTNRSEYPHRQVGDVSDPAFDSLDTQC